MARIVRIGEIAFVWLWSLAVTWWSLEVFIDNLPNRDFTAFYRSAETWFSMRDFYDVENIGNVNINPPHASALMFVPMLLWPLPVASVIWFVVQAAAGAAAFWLVQRELRLPFSELVWAIPLFLGSCALQHHWREGQVTGFLMLLATTAWLAARRESRTTAAWTAAAISIKPWLVCWLPVLRLRTALTTIAMGVAGITAGVLIFGLPTWLEWQSAVETKLVRPMVVNLSILAAIARAVKRPLGNDGSGWPYDQPLWVALVVVVIALTWWGARSASTDRKWLTFGLAGILVSPLGWAYYLVAVTGPLLAWGHQARWPWPALLAVAALMVTRELMQELTLFPNGWFGGSIAFFGVLLLWATALFWPQRVAAAGAARAA